MTKVEWISLPCVREDGKICVYGLDGKRLKPTTESGMDKTAIEKIICDSRDAHEDAYVRGAWGRAFGRMLSAASQRVTRADDSKDGTSWTIRLETMACSGRLRVKDFKRKMGQLLSSATYKQVGCKWWQALARMACKVKTRWESKNSWERWFANHVGNHRKRQGRYERHGQEPQGVAGKTEAQMRFDGMGADA